MVISALVPSLESHLTVSWQMKRSKMLELMSEVLLEAANRFSCVKRRYFAQRMAPQAELCESVQTRRIQVGT